MRNNFHICVSRCGSGSWRVVAARDNYGRRGWSSVTTYEAVTTCAQDIGDYNSDDPRRSARGERALYWFARWRGVKTVARI